MIRKLLWVLAALVGVLGLLMLIEACWTGFGLGRAARGGESAFGPRRREE